MKVWCETCSGFGRVGNYLEDYDCPNCEGEGFTENETIEKDAELGQAIRKWFDSGKVVVAKCVSIWTEEDLILWAGDGSE